MPTDSAWTCKRCRSHQWVGWASGPGNPRRAQCVPCGWVQALPTDRPAPSVRRAQIPAEAIEYQREVERLKTDLRIANTGIDTYVQANSISKARADESDRLLSEYQQRIEAELAVKVLMEARDAARANWHTAINDGRDEETARHWSATAGWLKTRADHIAAGDEPDWPDAVRAALGSTNGDEQ